MALPGTAKARAEARASDIALQRERQALIEMIDSLSQKPSPISGDEAQALGDLAQRVASMTIGNARLWDRVAFMEET